jgi:polyisoprenoid-binding protein YceI
MKRLKLVVAMVILMAAGAANAVDWRVDNETFKFSFVSIKKQHTVEVHHFKQVSGTLSDSGDFVLNIDLSSVETGIEVRNERMQTMLFNVAQFPTATLTAGIDAAQLAALAVAESQKMTVEASLNISSMSQLLSLDVLVIKLAANKILVVSAHPVIIKADEFALAKGVEALREVAGLPVISQAVPVSFYLTLNANN